MRLSIIFFLYSMSSIVRKTSSISGNDIVVYKMDYIVRAISPLNIKINIVWSAVRDSTVGGTVSGSGIGLKKHFHSSLSEF